MLELRDRYTEDDDAVHLHEPPVRIDGETRVGEFMGADARYLHFHAFGSLQRGVHFALRKRFRIACDGHGVLAQNRVRDPDDERAASRSSSSSSSPFRCSLSPQPCRSPGDGA